MSSKGDINRRGKSDDFGTLIQLEDTCFAQIFESFSVKIHGQLVLQFVQADNYDLIFVHYDAPGQKKTLARSELFTNRNEAARQF